MYFFSVCFSLYFVCQDKAEVSNLIAPFASGIVGLMSSLVGGWTKMQGNSRAEMANQFSDVAKKVLSGVSSQSGPSSSAAAPRVTRACTAATKGGRSSVPDPSKSVLPDDTDFLGDNSDTDESSSDGDDAVNRYIRAPRDLKGVPDGKSVHSQTEDCQNFGGVDTVPSQEDSEQFVHFHDNTASHDDPVASHDDPVATHTEVVKPALHVYKAGQNKKKLLTVGQKDVAIKGIVVQELAKNLSVTKGMMLSVVSEMPKGPDAAKKFSPKRYNVDFYVFSFLDQ